MIVKETKNKKKQKKNNQTKKTCGIVDFSVPADHKGKLNESKKGYQYLVLARKLKKQNKKQTKKKKWNTKGTMISIVTGALVTIPKGLVKGF